MSEVISDEEKRVQELVEKDRLLREQFDKLSANPPPIERRAEVEVLPGEKGVNLRINQERCLLTIEQSRQVALRLRQCANLLEKRR
jgi:hypothetical protein